MAMLNFDATQIKPDEGQLDPIPTDWYNMIVDQSEIKPTRANNGDFYLSVRCSVIDGKYANRKVFAQFNIKNSNPTAQEIAYKQLSALAHAVGVLQVADSQQLHNIPFKGRVKLVGAVMEPDNVTVKYPAKNEMAAFKHISEQVGIQTAGVAQGNPFVNAGTSQQGNPFGQMPQAATQATPGPTIPVAQPQVQQQWAPPAQGAQPWAQPQTQQAPAQQAPVPDWANQAAPAPQQAPAQQAPAAPAVPDAAVQQAQSSVPPWMKQ